MRKILQITVVLLLVLFLNLYIQFHRDITYAYQRVLDGSEILVTENGVIEYAVEGNGIPALLIHGAGGGYDQGLLMGKTAFGDGFKLISVSRFGYLRSSFLEESTVENQAALYTDLLDHLEVDKVVILGGSAGGPSALQFAHDYPQRSIALIMLSAVSMYMGDEIPLTTKIVNTIQKSDFTYWLVLKLFRSQFLEMVGISQETYNALGPDDKRLTDEMLEFMNPMSPRRPGNIHEAEIKPLTSEAMSRITVPTIILHAKDDILVTYDHAEFVHNNIEHSELVSFDIGGHGLFAETKEITKQIKDFLDKNR